jgi:hypothetical protein
VIDDHLHNADELRWWAGSKVIGTASRLSRSFQGINCPMRPPLAAVSVHLSQRHQLVLAAGDAERRQAAARPPAHAYVIVAIQVPAGASDRVAAATTAPSAMTMATERESQ